MATDVAPSAVDDLVRTALTVSRAQLMLSGLAEAVPDPLRACAVDFLDELGRAVGDLRAVAVRLHSPPQVPAKTGPRSGAYAVSPAAARAGSPVMDVDQERAEHTRMPAASFSYVVAEDRWEWSDEMYRLHGFERGEVVPTTQLLLAHKHPGDVESVRTVFEAAIVDGRPFVCRHRLIDIRLRERRVVSFGRPEIGPDGRVRVVHGVVADVTEPELRETKAATTAAVEGAHATRSGIDQAKGALMVRCGLDADEAFTVLRLLSNHANVRLHEIAEVVLELLGEAVTPGCPEETAAQLLDAVRQALSVRS